MQNQVSYLQKAVMVLRNFRDLCSVLYELKKLLFVCIGNRDQLIRDFDSITLNGNDFMKGHHVRFMNTADDSCRDQPFKLTEILQGHHPPVFRMNAPVVAHPFNVHNFAKHNFFKAVFRFYENKFRGISALRCDRFSMALLTACKKRLKVKGLSK